ncbi:MAG: acyltransferase family protein [Clostridiales bacterium]|nr:acyltransferase family protein [Clostridiales bacterium]
MTDNCTDVINKERNDHFDNIKAVLIFLVVLGHVFRNLGANGDEYLVYKIIYSFHMPAFLFVSGYFMKYDPKSFFAKMVPLRSLLNRCPPSVRHPSV